METMVGCGDGRLRTTTFWGLLLLGIGTVVLPGFLFTALMSRLLPPSNYPLIAAIRNDRYYCYLVPLTLPILVIAVYFHWLSMKLFKHA
ncbi:hypothetical protein HRI_001829100 [Hibiscus trionum]|uniref:Phosphatidylinositol N-acetylglucosaminyltransferase subunit Y n=1 Tax=Hibiscus trionum TaxID=183268 RepID=A0A9W7HQB2_HIBTR|nr:hypothetical protein HRI_001829100 [Hibiscus trionum]